jgi:hypothetical protein
MRPEIGPEFFDGLVSDSRISWIDHKIDRALVEGVTWREYLGALEAWLSERRSLGALTLVARALIHRGSRADLQVVAKYSDLGPAAVALLADTTFALLRRTVE